MWEEGETQHQISCSKSARGYTLWLDDAWLTTCKRYFSFAHPGFYEECFTLLGYAFCFFLYNNTLEIFVNGYSLKDQTDLRVRTEAVRKEYRKLARWMITLGCIGLLIFLAFWLVLGKAGPLLALLFISLFYIGVGVYRILANKKQAK